MKTAFDKKRIIIAASVLVILLIIVAVIYNKPDYKKISYNRFLDDVDSGKIEKVFLYDDAMLEGIYKNGEYFVTDNPRKETLKEDLLKQNIKVDEKQQRLQIEKNLSMLFIMVLFGAVLYKLSKKASRQLQKDSKLAVSAFKPDEKTGVTFANIAGNEEAKESIQEIVDFIKQPEKYTRYGARLPRGIIFYGLPGTGKTLMAKAVAGEAGVPFFAVSGSDFVQVYVGVGAGRIRDLFKKARSCGRCVIFIDEIDALGKKRDGLGNGGNDERDQTLNALLSEMSGFNKNDGIVVIAATNRIDTLDEALLRPGRFDRHIEIGLPDIKSRHKILKLHTKDKPIDKDVDLNEIAGQTVYFSGAKLENLVNEAAILAAKRNSGVISKEDFDKAFYIVVAGSEKKDRSVIAETDRKITAYHEAGHALVTRLVAPENKVSRITIIPSTKGAGGFSMSIPPDRMYYRKKDMENSIRIALAGRASEEIIFGSENITSGAANDLEKATDILLNMVRRFGMKTKSGLLNYDILYQNGFRDVQDDVLDECRDSMDSLYKEVKDLLEDNIDLLKAISEELLIKESLDQNDLDNIIGM